MWVKIIQIPWSFLVLITFGTSNSQDIPDITLISQKESKNKYHMTCVVGEKTDSAIAWNLPLPPTKDGVENLVSDYVPSRPNTYKCNIDSESESCNRYWSVNDWKIQKSLDNLLLPVTDRRWEDFKIYYTSGENIFQYITYLENPNFAVHFSIRTKQEAHIYLCNNKYPPNGKCYWILLGGFDGKSTAIRKCAKERVPETGFPKSDCRTTWDMIHHDPEDPLLNEMEWKHFVIERLGNKVLLWQVGLSRPLLNYFDEASYIKMPYLSIKSRETPGYWKFHDYSYTFVDKKQTAMLGETMYVRKNEICFAMFVAMCEGCNLKLQLIGSYIIWENIVKPRKAMQWQEVKFTVALPVTGMHVRLSVSSICPTGNCDSPFWAIDDFQTCTEKEIRILSIDADKTQRPQCQLIKYPQRHLFQTEIQSDTVSESNCPSGTFSNKCIDCGKVLGSTKAYCEKSIVCEIQSDGKSACRCARGYSGTDCESRCPAGLYGSGCTESCGFCMFSPCNFVTGDCVPPRSGCLHKFSDKRCKIPPFPILLNPPTVIDIGHEYFTVQIRNNSYEGNTKPWYYRIEYREVSPNPSTKWIEWKQFTFADTDPITVNKNLKILTKYTVRAILLTENNEAYTEEYVRKVNVTTTCSVFTQNDITIDTTNISAVILFKSNLLSCPLSDYEVSINDRKSKTLTGPNFSLSNLKPATVYYLTVMNKMFNISFTKDFTTADGAPESVEELKTINQSPTSLTISWKEPLVKNGKINYYYIRYKHEKYLACGDELDKEFEGNIREESTSAVINNLLPYSEYTVEVVAVTVINGKPFTIKCSTSQTDSLEESEIPSIKSIIPKSTEAEVILDIPKCTLIQGLVVLYIKLECLSNWCLPNSKNITLTENNYGPIKLKNLQPYCNYKLKIKIGREKGNVYNENELEATFNTKTSVPRKLTSISSYSKDENSLSLRLKPPFPPTGEVTQYYITYCYTQFGAIWDKEICKEHYFDPIICKLWNNFHCLTIKELEPRKLYKIQIQSKNNGTNFGSKSESKSFITVQEAPGILENFTATWDDSYNLNLTWGHPNVTNGPLTKFVIRISTESQICYEENVPISEENYTLTYSYTILFDKCYSSTLYIRGAAFNKQEGPSFTKILQSPPRTPFSSNEPTIETVTNTTITINLPALKGLEKISFMYVIVSTKNSDFQYTDNNELMPKICKNLNFSKDVFSWIVAEYDFTKIKSSERVLVIGDGTNTKSTRFDKAIHNQVLHSTTSYVISIAVFNEFMEFKRCNVTKIEARISGIEAEMEKESSEGSNIGLCALLLLVLIPIAFFVFIIYRRKKKAGVSWQSMLQMNINAAPSSSNPDVIPLSTTTAKKPRKVVVPSSQLRPKRILPIGDPENSLQPSTSTTTNEFSKPVKITQFEEYVKESIQNGELDRQHQLFRRGQTKPWDYGLLPQNKSKNRYNNLVAYDHTRVKLGKMNNDPYSDYINANYIEGYNTKKAYIATQGPKISTVNDFWRMIWQDNVRHIIMLANVIEAGKKKTEQYWPNVNESLEFGNIKVQYVSSRVFADYEYRTFSVFCKNEERRIEQLHFTSWPDHAVPLYSQSLVPFLRKILTIPQGTSPIVVHCSAGVGRTGTIILADLCLRMAAREGVVDVLKHQANLRQQRANLVDNIEQYKLAHLVLLECLIAPHTSLTCDEEMEGTVLSLLESERVAQQMVYLNETAWQDQAMRPPLKIKVIPEWTKKNRFQDIIPYGYGRVFLSRYPASDEHSDYINAVEVDGFRSPQRFIVTQKPLPHTMSDFWRMIDEKEVTTIVLLNQINLADETTCVFWPTTKEIQPVPYVTLQFHDKSSTEHYSTITIHLHNTKDKKNPKRTVHLIILKGWPSNNLLPNDEDSLLKLWEDTERISRGPTPIVVACHNGAKACGLFIALSFVVEKMKLEQECDVCLAVRTVRHNRKQFVTEIDQFLFLYRAALKYLSCFDLYSNFTSAGKK